MKKSVRRAAVFMLGVLMCAVTACGQKKPNAVNLADDRETEQKTVYLFGSMEKSKPNAKNTARSAADLTIMQAEEKLGLEVEYRTYTAENYQEKTYDDVALDRARNAMDDLYLLNPDTIKTLGVEGKLADLSGLKSAENLREVVKTARITPEKTPTTILTQATSVAVSALDTISSHTFTGSVNIR